MAAYYTSDSESSSTPVESPGGSSPFPRSSPSLASPSTASLTEPCRETCRDIAIIGFSFEFPGANSEESFWDLLSQGQCAATPFPPDRFHYSRFQEKICPQKASFVQRDIGSFDARFFGITKDEALGTDPQLRILLETAYRALENAGIPIQNISGTDASVYTGCFTADYTLATSKDPENAPRYSATGMAQSMLSNRISAFFNLTGPSVTIDTACSSSLVALDMACRSIREGESSMGIVAGCNLLLAPDLFISLSSLGFLSPDGVCHSFDNRANGYGRGEGFGVLIVKPVDAAIRDGDTIRAVIRATGTNQNGRTNLALPSKEMQRQLIEETYRKAHLDKSRTRFFEAHGTGTPAGDPLEAMAIGNAFSQGRDADDPVVIGAVKASIGHLEGSAGIAGVIKTILVLERGVIPPIAQLEQLNCEIDAEFLKLKFPTATLPWPKPGLRRASINSFGFGGTNAHAILDDAFHYLQSHGRTGKHRTNVQIAPNLESMRLFWGPPQLARRDPGMPKLFTWSANEPKAVTRMLEAYRTHLEKRSRAGEMTEDRLDALAYTLSKKRSLLPWRSFAVASSVSQLIEELQAPKEALQALADPKTGFVFTGQGAQWLGMARELFAFPSFRDSVLNADEFIRSLGCEWKASDVLQSNNGQSGINIDEPRFAQPLCTIVQVALVELLQTFRIYPTTVIGHSSGEIAAAYTIGAISRESAWKLAYLRGLLSSQLADSSSAGTSPRGSMMAVGLSESSIQPYIENIQAKDSRNGILTVACVNSPDSVTVSGDEDLVWALQSRLNQEGIFARVLKVPVAYHSPHMEAVASSYKQLIGTLSHGGEPAHYATMISSVTGDNIGPSELQKAEYWVQNMVSQVRFSPAIERLCQNSAKKPRKKLDMSHRKFAPVSHLLEIGPHSALQGPIRQTIDAVSPRVNITYTSALVRGKPANSTLLEALGNLHCLGFAVDLNRANDMTSSLGVSKGPPVGLPLTLPEYPFDRTQTYWHEPRSSKNLRSQSQQYSEFLGSQVADWNPLEPRWRNALRASSIPWVQDHKINGDILYPAAGMWVMAIEAITQISPGQKIVGYEIRDTAMLSSLVIPADDTEVEVQFRLKPVLDSSNKSASWADFTLYASRGENSYVEICRGSVKAVFAAQGQSSSQDGSGSSQRQIDHTRNMMQLAKLDYSSEIRSDELYARLDENGYQYGVLFQGIQVARRNSSGQAVGEVALRDPPPSSSASRSPPTVIHPCHLDSVLQLCLPALVRPGDADTKKETWVPTYLSKLWIPASGFRGQVQVHASTQARSTRLCDSSIQAVSLEPTSGDDDGILLISGAELTLIASSQPSSHAKPPSRLPRRLCYDLVRSPDISFLTPLETSQYIHSHPPLPPDPTDFLRTLKLYILCSMSRAVSSTPLTSIPPSRPHLQRQHRWMQSILASATAQAPPGLPADWTAHVPDAPFEALSARLAGMSGLGAIHVAFGRHVPAVLRGDADPLEILTRDDMLKEYYALFNQSLKFFAPMARYLDLLAHKNPAMKILEVGAGTGVTTAEVLKTLVGGGETGARRWCRFGRYDFTDVSPAFLEKVKAEEGGVFAGLGERMQFGVLDVESDAVEQGFEEGSYDLCIAVNVLHATKSLRESLRNIRRLLKDTGKLLLIEITDPSSAIGPSIFGYLPGWWRSAELWRQNGPIATISDWDRELKATGFDGTDLVVPNYEKQENQFASLIISTATTPGTVEKETPSLTTLPASASADKTAVVLTGLCPTASKPSHLTDVVVSRLREAAMVADVQKSTFLELAAQQDSGAELVVVVHDPSSGWPSFAHLTPEEYGAFHSIFSRARAVLWLVFSSSPDAIGPVHGFARALRRERHGLVFSTVGLDPTTPCPSLLSAHISKAVENFLHGVSTGTCEWELNLGPSSQVTIPRVYESRSLDEAILHYTSASLGTPIFSPAHPFSSLGFNVKLAIRQPGLLDSLYFTSSPDPPSPLPPRFISVAVKAIGINFRDCLIALGRVDQDTMGSECAGVVLAVGSEVDNVQPGDKVLVSACDTFQTVISCSAQLAVKIPPNMAFPEAASIPTNFITAYHALVRVARLSKGESILIHSGAGGTGQAAVQIAQWCNAGEIFITVSSEGKKKLMVDKYGIPSERILNSRDLSFADDIRRLTSGKGVDVVLNSLAGDALVAGWECVAPYGRFIEIGKKDIFGHGKLPMFQFAKNVSFCAVDLSALTVDRPEVIQEELGAVVELFRQGVLRLPEPMKAFSITEVEVAFRYLQSGKNAGKVVVEVGEDDVVPAVIQPKKSEWTFNPHASFIIAGGLGAMGRIIATWMVSKGARHLVLLSRQGLQTDNTKVTGFVHSLETSGANVYCPPCDVADAKSLRAALDHCRENMPPIKGCIQAAMVLRDGFFENMSHDDWSAPLGPKIDGSWNLHEQLPRDLDFFILFSSIAGIVGSQAQANYAAGNTFQDELARYRVTQLGERALSVNLSLVQGDGFAVEHPDLAQQFVLTKHVVEMSQDEMLGLLDHVCSPAVATCGPTSPPQQQRSQIVMGLDLPSHARARGMDPPGWMHEPMFANLHQLEMDAPEDDDGCDADRSTNAVGENKKGHGHGPDLLTRVKEAPGLADAAQVVSDALVNKLCKVLARAPESFDRSQPLHVYGVDSLVAVELRNWFSQGLKVDVAVFEILGGSTCETIGRGVAEKVLGDA